MLFICIWVISGWLTGLWILLRKKGNVSVLDILLVFTGYGLIGLFSTAVVLLMWLDEIVVFRKY